MLTRRDFLTVAGAPAIVRSAHARLGYPRHEIDRMIDRGAFADKLTRDDIPTPALLLDLDAFEWNVARMAAHLKARGKALRPHGKTHKCPDIARALLRAGAAGQCAAKLSEAEAFAAHGLKGLLITTEVVGRPKIARAVALAAKQPDTIFVVDDPQNVRDLNEAAGAFRGRPSLELNLAVDLLYGRTGIAAGSAALDLAKLIDSLPQVRLAGIQAYDGAASHTVGFEERRRRSAASMAQAVETRRLFEAADEIFETKCSKLIPASYW